MGEPEGDDENRVPLGLDCPVCTESNMDCLLMGEDDVVLCTSCHTRYSVASGRAVIIVDSQP